MQGGIFEDFKTIEEDIDKAIIKISNFFEDVLRDSNNKSNDVKEILNKKCEELKIIIKILQKRIGNAKGLSTREKTKLNNKINRLIVYKKEIRNSKWFKNAVSLYIKLQAKFGCMQTKENIVKMKETYKEVFSSFTKEQVELFELIFHTNFHKILLEKAEFIIEYMKKFDKMSELKSAQQILDEKLEDINTNINKIEQEKIIQKVFIKEFKERNQTVLEKYKDLNLPELVERVRNLEKELRCAKINKDRSLIEIKNELNALETCKIFLITNRELNALNKRLDVLHEDKEKLKNPDVLVKITNERQQLKELCIIAGAVVVERYNILKNRERTKEENIELNELRKKGSDYIGVSNDIPDEKKELFAICKENCIKIKVARKDLPSLISPISG